VLSQPKWNYDVFNSLLGAGEFSSLPDANDAALLSNLWASTTK
jgi:hypothetical protein